MRFEKCPICQTCVPSVNKHVYKAHSLREILSYAWHEDQEGFWYIWAILAVAAVTAIFLAVGLLDYLNVV